MSIKDLNRTLPSNRMIFELRHDPARVERFRADMEAVMEKYGLSEAEKEAFRHQDIRALAKMGVHPYFLPQVSRLYRGGAYNHNDSPAAELYRRNMIDKQD
ncbi:MAG: hypothetical protein WED00_09400 [Aquisalimonadaceae bacterium]